MTVVFRRNVARMEGYAPGEQPGERGFIKLNTNENPYPPSPSVRKAILRELGEPLRLYPDPGSTALRRQAALTYGFELPGVIAGNGSDDLLAMIARAFVGEGELLACPVPTYTLYDTLVRIQGGRLAGVPYPDDYSLPRGLAAKKARVTIVASPNSPSGTAVPVRALAELADAVPGLLVVDEAYADFADGTALGLARERRNVIVLRTLSKSFSLAGMRIGLGFAHPRIIEGLDKVRDSYNLNRLSIAAGVAALADAGWMERNAARIRKTRGALAAGLLDLVGPAPVVREDLAAEDGRVLEAGVVDQHRHVLALYVHTGVVVPVALGGDDSVAHEHDLAPLAHRRVVPHRPKNEVVLPGERAGCGPGDRERGLGGERDDRHPIEIGAAVARRLEAEPLELGGDVLRRRLAAPGAGRAALEHVVGQELEVRAEHARVQRAGHSGTW